MGRKIARVLNIQDINFFEKGRIRQNHNLKMDFSDSSEKPDSDLQKVSSIILITHIVIDFVIDFFKDYKNVKKYSCLNIGLR